MNVRKITKLLQEIYLYNNIFTCIASGLVLSCDYDLAYFTKQSSHIKPDFSFNKVFYLRIFDCVADTLKDLKISHTFEFDVCTVHLTTFSKAIARCPLVTW